MEIPNLDSVNPYIYCLFGNEENLDQFMNTLESVSTFYSITEPSLPTLGTMIGKISGLQILTHSIESATLPTWHALTAPHGHVNQSKKIDDEKYATYIRYLQNGPEHTGTLDVPDATTVTLELLQVEVKKISPTKRAFRYLKFNRRTNLLPDVFWFQPYTRGTSTISHSLILGLKIESSEIDSYVLPIPNPTTTLIDENSQYLIGSIPSIKLVSWNTINGQTSISMRERTTHDESQTLGLARRNCATNALASYCSENVNTVTTKSFSYDRETGHNRLSAGTTYCAWSSNLPCPYPDHSIYLWSSYRTNIGRKPCAARNVCLYYSLSGLYGTNTVLSKSRHPAKMLP